jgi:sensor c-di-GMP phosphodiesterase-like protein
VKRLHVIIIASLLAIIGAAVPLAAMLQISRTLAEQTEQARLEQVARQVIARANSAFAEASAALHAIASATPTPCSDEHVALMRKLTVNTRAIDEMGYFSGGQLACTSWGRTEERIALTPGDYVTRDGIMVDVGVRPRVSGANARLALQYRDHNVLLDPAQLVDVLAPSGMQLAIASDTGVLVGALNGPDPELLRSLLARPRIGMDATHLFAAARADGWIAVATQPRDQIQPSLQRQRMLLLPVGAFIAALIVGIVIWLSRRRLSPLGELTIAVRKREFVVHYQPIIDLETGICVGAEALVRWRRPDGSLVRPDLFIPLAEESGLIIPITDQVVAAVIADLGALLVADRSLHIAINLCAEDIKTGRILDVIQGALAPTDIRPQQIWLEATERGFIDIDPARETIAKARRLGHSVAIDDFGTGYSSLQYLQGLPLDALKIDKSFIDTIGRNTATSSVTSHIIEMAKTLNLFIVAEGVETREQLDYLRAHGVHFAQGWFFAKPLPAAEFAVFHRQRKERYGSGPDVIQRAAA